MILSLLITLFSAVSYADTNTAIEPTTVELRRIEIRDTSLYYTLNQAVSDNPKCFIPSLYSLDISRSCLDQNRFLINIGDFSSTVDIKDSIGYYCIIGGRTFILGKNIPDELFVLSDGKLTVRLEECPVYIDRDLSFCFCYVKGRYCFPVSMSCW